MINFLALSSTEITIMVVWAIIAIVAIVIEFETINLVSIWFAAGAVAGIICSLLHQKVWIQVLAFVVVSAVFIIGTRPFVKKISENQTILTNVDRLIGMTALITKPIKEGEKGEIKVDYQIWPAIAKNDEEFQEGEKVVIFGIQGNKMIVEKIKEINLD